MVRYGVPIYHIMDGLNINKISKHLNKYIREENAKHKGFVKMQPIKANI